MDTLEELEKRRDDNIIIWKKDYVDYEQMETCVTKEQDVGKKGIYRAKNRINRLFRSFILKLCMYIHVRAHTGAPKFI
jgi:hypothetical protein